MEKKVSTSRFFHIRDLINFESLLYYSGLPGYFVSRYFPLNGFYVNGTCPYVTLMVQNRNITKHRIIKQQTYTRQRV